MLVDMFFFFFFESGGRLVVDVGEEVAVDVAAAVR